MPPDLGNNGLPSTNIVCLYSVASAGGDDTLCELKSYFDKKGIYDTSHYNANATIDDLAKLPKCSVLYLNTHNVINPKTKIWWGLEAGEIRDGDLETYDAEVKDELLIPSDDGTTWIIDYEYIRRKWRFETNSFVFINGCNSSDSSQGRKSLASIIQNECGASVYGGWSMGNASNCEFGNLFLFDRLLGTNAYAPRKKNPVRPFTWKLVLEEMVAKGSNDVLVLPLENKNIPPYHTLLNITASGKGDFGLLAPSIEYLEINEKELKVTLHGFFGTDQSKLRVFLKQAQFTEISLGSDIELAIDSCTDSRTLVCKDVPAKGTISGYIVVAIDYGNNNFLQSNPVPVTSWEGTFTYTVFMPGGKDGKDTELGKITWKGVIRGDVHTSRKKPGENPPDPHPKTFAMIWDMENKATFTCGGTYTGGEKMNTYKWKGSGSLFYETTPGGGALGINGWYQYILNPGNPKLFINMFTAENGITISIYDKDGKPIVENNLWSINISYLAREVNKPDPFFIDFLQGSVTWDPSYDIPGKVIPAMTDWSLGPDLKKIFPVELKWEDMSAKHPPDTDTPA